MMATQTNAPIQSGLFVARLVRFFCLLAPVAAPCLGSICILQLMGFNFSNYGPGATCNDEIGHFLEAQAFTHAGFNPGYFGAEEHRPTFSYSHFSVYGPIYPMLSGLLGKLFGISFASTYYFNLVYITLALTFFVLLVPLSNIQLLAMSLFLLVYWPFYHTAYSWKDDCLHYAIAVVLAACFYHLFIKSPLSASTGFRLGFFAFLCFASLVRISWSMFFIPLFLFYWPGTTRLGRAAAVAASCLLILALLFLVRQLCAPFPCLPNAMLMTKLIAWEVDFEVLQNHIHNNLINFWRLCRESDTITRTMFLLTLSVLGYMSVLCLIQTIRPKFNPANQNSNENENLASGPNAWFAFNIYNLGAIILSTIVLYHVGGNGGLRIFSVHFLLTIMLAFAFRSRVATVLCATAILVMCLTANSATVKLKNWYTPYFSAGVQARQFHESVKNVIIYEPGADPWHNTLLTNCYSPHLAGLPAGIGANSYFSGEFLKNRVKSRYIISTPDLVAVHGLNVKLLVSLHDQPGSMGNSEHQLNLYLNLNTVSGYTSTVE
jgi:hypothetical protein